MGETSSTRATTERLAPITVRRDHDIYSTDGGWYRARWHFSFDQYYDRANMGIGTLRVFNHDTLVPGAAWPMHPHRDIEGITYVVAGTFEHADGMENEGVLSPGGVQRMTLGSGAWHSERNHSQTEPMEFIQMWIIPEQQGLDPSMEQQQYTEEDRHNKLLRILKPEGQAGEGVVVHQDVRMYVARLDPGVSVEHVFGQVRGGYFYLIDGEIQLNGERLGKGDAAKVLGDGRLVVQAKAVSEMILVDTPL